MALMIIEPCTACDACPENCIVPNPDWEESPDDLLAKYQQLHG